MPEKVEFSSEDVAMGPPGFVSPLSVCFSSDGKMVSYLFPDQKGSRQVFAVDTDDASFESFQLIQNDDSNKELSLQEQLRRERMRLFYQWNINLRMERNWIQPYHDSFERQYFSVQ